MSYTIALNSFANNSSAVVSDTNELFRKKSKSSTYTSVDTLELVHNLSQKSKKAITKIKSLSQLDDNWDSYGAEKPSNISINNAIKFIKKADKDKLEVYFIAPGVNGDTLVEYKFSNKISAEIYFNSDGTNELLVFGENQCFIEGNIENEYNELIRLANEQTN